MYGSCHCPRSSPAQRSNVVAAPNFILELIECRSSDLRENNTWGLLYLKMRWSLYMSLPIMSDIIPIKTTLR